MKRKITLLVISLMALLLSGCVWYGGYGYHGYPYGHGYHHGYYDNQSHRGWDHDYHGSGGGYPYRR